MDITMQESRRQSLSELITHIEQSHHVFTREALIHIRALFNAPELVSVGNAAEIRVCFEELEADLMPHLMKEERVLFPYIVALESNSGQPSTSCFGSIANPIRMMGMEHRAVQNLLGQLRELTANYHPLSEDSATVSALYATLEALDRDLVEHIRLEGDVLFPQALELERSSSIG